MVSLNPAGASLCLSCEDARVSQYQRKLQKLLTPHEERESKGIAGRARAMGIGNPIRWIAEESVCPIKGRSTFQRHILASWCVCVAERK